MLTMKRLVPVAIPFALVATVLLFLFGSALRSHQLPMYAGDDAYIHLAVVKHIVQDHVWGNTAFAYAPCSSSPLWTVLLSSIALVASPSPWLPLICNLASFAALLCLADRILVSHGWTTNARACTLLALAFATPTVYVLSLGMEHSLQAALDLALMYVAYNRWKEGGREVKLLLLSFLATTVRFEGLALVVAIAFADAIYSRRCKFPLLMVVAGLAPIALFALLSVKAGGPVLPYSVMVKGAGASSIAKSVHAIYVTGLVGWLVGAWLTWALIPKSNHPLRTVVAAFSGTCTVLALSGGWPTRYSFWVMPVIVVFGAVALKEYHDANRVDGRAYSILHPSASGAIAMALVCLVTLPSLFLANMVKSAQNNYYQLHLPLAEFIRSEPEDKVIGLFDIGLASYLARGHIVDLAGLASADVAQARIANKFDTEAIERIAKSDHVDYTVLFPNQFTGNRSLPKEWVHVGEWSLANNVVALDYRMDFVATSPQEAVRLRSRLAELAGHLPTGLHQRLFSLTSTPDVPLTLAK